MSNIETNLKKNKGITTIAMMVSVAGAVITIGGIVFGFGGTIASLKNDTASAKESSAIAIEKADLAITQVAELKGKIDAIYNGLLRTGLADKIK